MVSEMSGVRGNGKERKPSPKRILKGFRAPASRRKKGPVLVMDDDTYVTELLCEMLSQSGYEACAVSNGEEAIQRFTRAKVLGRPISTVILDLNIPSGMGGSETFGKLRDMDPGVRAILLTGDISHPEISRYRESGFRAALLKPFTRAELMQALSWTSEGPDTDGTPPE